MIDIRTCFTYAYSAGTYADFFQTVTADAASTNLIDLDVAGIKIAGGSKPPWLIARVGTAFATTVSINFRLQTDSASGFATTLRDVMTVRVPLANLDAAGDLAINQPIPHFDYQRYMRVYFDVFTNATAGTI